jgi:hypothetical protein
MSPCDLAYTGQLLDDCFRDWERVCRNGWRIPLDVIVEEDSDGVVVTGSFGERRVKGAFVSRKVVVSSSSGRLRHDGLAVDVLVIPVSDHMTEEEILADYLDWSQNDLRQDLVSVKCMATRWRLPYGNPATPRIRMLEMVLHHRFGAVAKTRLAPATRSCGTPRARSRRRTRRARAGPAREPDLPHQRLGGERR